MTLHTSRIWLYCTIKEHGAMLADIKRSHRYLLNFRTVLKSGSCCVRQASSCRRLRTSWRAAAASLGRPWQTRWVTCTYGANSVSPIVKQICNQCDQSGQFFKLLAPNFLAKVAKILGIAYAELGTDLHVCLNPVQSNRRSFIQWYFLFTE